jgi:hypothetical protein
MFSEAVGSFDLLVRCDCLNATLVCKVISPCNDIRVRCFHACPFASKNVPLSLIEPFSKSLHILLAEFLYVFVTDNIYLYPPINSIKIGCGKAPKNAMFCGGRSR